VERHRGEGRRREMFHVKQSGGKWTSPHVVLEGWSSNTGTTYTPYIYYRYRMYRQTTVCIHIRESTYKKKMITC
jgi:hypothetical protein